jgi:hypothetical protein
MQVPPEVESEVCVMEGVYSAVVGRRGQAAVIDVEKDRAHRRVAYALHRGAAEGVTV